MKYKKSFEELIDKSILNDQYVGLGNPNSKILFVGKEAGMPINSQMTHGSGKSWKENKNEYWKRYSPREKNIKNKNHTWQKYQKLYELIEEKLNAKDDIPKNNPYEITFVENVFTTELSNLSAPTTKEAKSISGFEANLKNRKKVFWNSDFIKQFPIILITASDNKYIETYQGEVCELFDVEFTKEYSIGKLEKMWVHYANENELFPKLVIHTRQLTNGASNKLLEEIADLIKDFVEKYSIKIKKHSTKQSLDKI